MVLTALMFVYVIIRQFKANFAFIRSAAVTFTLMFALLCFSRPDAIIARYNMEYCSEQLSFQDITEMCDLSSDAAAVITEEQYEELVQNKYMKHKYADEDMTGTEYINQRIERNLKNSTYNYYNISAIKLNDQITK